MNLKSKSKVLSLVFAVLCLVLCIIGIIEKKYFSSVIVFVIGIDLVSYFRKEEKKKEGEK